MNPIVLNARAAMRTRITGVERWAVELTRRLPQLRPDCYVVLRPPPALAHRAGQVWEQSVLPARASRLHASLIWSPANIAPLLYGRNVMVLHDAAVLRHPEAYGAAYRAWHSRIGTACARRALRVVTVSEFSRREIVELAGVAPDSVVVIRGGVDERFAPSADPDPVAERYGLERPYVLTVGTADRRKNLKLLAGVASRLSEFGHDLVWAGGGQSHIEGDQAIRGVVGLGYVAEQDLPGLYAGAAAFVLPSRYEGFGLTCVEAMASGVPVVAANRAALPETCAGAALLVDPDEHEQVTDAVIAAVSDKGLRQQLRARGLKRAAELTWDRTTRETDALLQRLAA